MSHDTERAIYKLAYQGYINAIGVDCICSIHFLRSGDSALLCCLIVWTLFKNAQILKSYKTSCLVLLSKQCYYRPKSSLNDESVIIINCPRAQDQTKHNSRWSVNLKSNLRWCHWICHKCLKQTIHEWVLIDEGFSKYWVLHVEKL